MNPEFTHTFARYAMCIVLLAIGISLPSSAHDFEYTYEGQTLTYTVTSDTYNTVKTKEGSYVNGSGGIVIFTPGNSLNSSAYQHLKIPATVKDGDTEYTVTRIGACSFPKQEMETVELPNTIVAIDDYAFSKCNNLSSFEIPNSVKGIGFCAFEGCKGLTSVILGNSIITVGEDAFSNCSSLTSIELPNSTRTLGYGAFSKCTSLTTVKLSSALTSVGQEVFLGSDAITTVEYPATEPVAAQKDMFSQKVYDSATLYVPTGAEQEYENVTPWNLFNKIEGKVFDVEITSAVAEEESTTEYYDLAGVRVVNPEKGKIYIMRKGNCTIKVIM